MILQQIFFHHEVQITLVYWLLIHEDDAPVSKEIIPHMLPMASALFEFCLTAWPFTLRHSYIVILSSLIYMLLVNMVSTYVNDEPVYEILNWKDEPADAFKLVGMLFAEHLVVIALLLGISQCKMRVYGKGHFLLNMK